MKEDDGDKPIYLTEEERIKMLKLIQHFKEELNKIPSGIKKKVRDLKQKLVIYTESMEMIEHFRLLEKEIITTNEVSDIKRQFELIIEDIIELTPLAEKIIEFNDRLENR